MVMKSRIIESASGLHDWFQTPPGRYVIDWERGQFDQAVVDLFGFNALQLGMPDLDALASNRMPQRWLALDHAASAGTRSTDNAGSSADGGGWQRLALHTDYAALPFPASSLDLVLLPHALELNPDPHATLREVERVLVPEGRVIICGLNPASLWGLRQRRAHLLRRLGFGELYLPDAGDFIGYWRLRDWLRLLNFEVETARFGAYSPAVRTEKWLRRLRWMDRVGQRWWPIFGAVYFIVAVKRVHGMRLLSPAWKEAPALSNSSVSIANKVHPMLDK